MMGAGAGPAWHAAKVAECGGQCTVNPRQGGVLMRVGKQAFDIEPLQIENQCSPTSVSAHLLYENSDPFRLTEPGGILDVSDADYQWVDDRITRVTGSLGGDAIYNEAEGAKRTRPLCSSGSKTPRSEPDEFHDHGTDRKEDHGNVRGRGGTLRPCHCVSTAERNVGRPVPAELRRHAMSASCSSLPRHRKIWPIDGQVRNPFFFHMPPRPGIVMPATPSIHACRDPRGFTSLLNHVVHTRDGFELVRTEWTDLTQAKEKVLENV